MFFRLREPIPGAARPLHQLAQALRAGDLVFIRIAALRMRADLDDEQRGRLPKAAERRLGIVFDTGFSLHSRRQFCSRYVREVLEEAAGVKVGEIETFAMLLNRRPAAALGFWKHWYFGRIPWHRETLTPAALLRSRALRPVFDGTAERS